jgi:hypothetical protein
MIDRTRAARRKKARNIVAKVKASKAWLNSYLERVAEMSSQRPTKITIPHKPGKLTPAQELRQRWATLTEVKDGFADAYELPVSANPGATG